MAFEEVRYYKEKNPNVKIYALSIFDVPTGYYKTGKSYEEFAEIMRKNTREDYEDFLKKAVSIVEIYLADTDFSQEKFCAEIGMSKASLYRKINSLTNQSINEFVRNIRLKKAAKILRSGKQFHIAELGYRVGFSEPSYFTKKFRELFGMTPKAYNSMYLKDESLVKNDESVNDNF